MHSSSLRNRIDTAMRTIRKRAKTHELIPEGSASLQELCYLAEVAQAIKGAPVFAEIGFNFGFSSAALLIGNERARVVSFDLASHDYVSGSKEIIDELFPRRHELIVGNSRKTVPAYALGDAHAEFALVFIDGGHSYATAKADLCNMRRLSNEDTVVIMDDLVPWLPWGIGPTLAWFEARMLGHVCENERRADGKLHQIRIWGRGRYLF